MLIPNEPTTHTIPTVSPSLYETLIGCPARASWYANGPRDAVAPHPSALLGTCFHAVMEGLQRGVIAGEDDEERRVAARKIFDELAAKIHSEAHPLIRVKFPSPERLPYYNLLRERAAVVAGSYSPIADRPERDDGARSPIAEMRFESSDRVIVGRPDLIDVARGEVVDYKTGQPAAEEAYRVSDREARQLRLYAYLAAQTGIAVTRGTIVRSNGDTASIDVSKDTADQEAEQARKLLSEFNSAIADGQSFYDVAHPSAPVCRFCPCIPFCEPFWASVEPSWGEECGCHLEGTVRSVEPANVQGTDLLTIEVDAERGTVRDCVASIEQVPTAWVLADGDRFPQPRDTIRLIDARLVSSEPPVLRADRVMTSLWRLGDEA